MERNPASLSIIPFDIIPQIILHVCRGISDETVDSSAIPLTLLILKHVNKRFNRVITNPKSIFYRILTNLKYLQAEARKLKVALMMHDACTYGSILLVEWCEKNLSVRMAPDWFFGAAEGNLLLVHLLIAEFCSGNHVHLLNWLKNKPGGKDILVSIGNYKNYSHRDLLPRCRAAVAKSGGLEVLEWANSNIPCFSYRYMLAPALRSGNLEAVKFICEKKMKPKHLNWNEMQILEAAADSASEQILQYALQHASSVSLAASRRISQIAARHSLPMMKMLLSFPQKCNVSVLESDFDSIAYEACCYGRIDVLQYLCAITGKKLSSSSDTKLMAGALCFCQVEVLRYLLEKGVSLPESEQSWLMLPFSSNFPSRNRLQFFQTLSENFGVPKDLLAKAILHGRNSNWQIASFFEDCPFEALQFLRSARQEVYLSQNELITMLSTSIHSSSSGALPAVRYLIEELGCDTHLLNRYPYNIYVPQIRKDVRQYLNVKQ